MLPYTWLGDHAKYVGEFEKCGIKVFKPFEKFQKKIKFGSFEIYPFELVHDVPTYGFLIRSPKAGTILYATDTCYIRYKFSGLQHIFIECNWSKECVDTESIKYQRELTSHMEQNTCMDFIKANSSDSLKTVVLCHLSDTAVDVRESITQARACVSEGVTVDFAAAGKSWILNKGDVCPFL